MSGENCSLCHRWLYPLGEKQRRTAEYIGLMWWKRQEIGEEGCTAFIWSLIPLVGARPLWLNELLKTLYLNAVSVTDSQHPNFRADLHIGLQHCLSFLKKDNG